MSAKKKTNDTENTDVDQLNEAALYVLTTLEESGDLDQCPYCSYTPVEASEKLSGMLGVHLKEKHPLRIFEVHQAKDLDASIKREPGPIGIHEEIGLEQVNTLDRHDFLYVPSEVKKQAEAEGASIQWAAPGKVRSWLDMGAQRVDLSKDELPTPGTQVDGLTRTREMVLIKIPQRLVEQRARSKASRINTQLHARAEDIQKTKSDHAKMAYDAVIKNGGDKTQAKNVAQAIEAGVERGHLRPKEGGAKLRINDPSTGGRWKDV